MHIYEVRPRADRRGVDLISEQLPFGKLRWGGERAAENAISYAQFFSRSHRAEVRVFNAAGELIETRKFDPSHIEAR
jgi:peroxiredoxin